jgi:hypothetical protein
MATGKSILGKSLWGVAGLALALSALPATLAQGRGFGPGGGRFGDFRMGPPVTGAPYSATMTITRVQKLADGTTITHTSVIKEARDSSGRLYRETLPESPGHSFTSYSVFDPVGRVSIRWSSDSKQASLMHLPDPSQLSGSNWGRGPHPEDRVEPDGAGPGPRFHGSLQPATTESLGSKTMNGLVADGTRTTRIIPAGTEGNDQPITITHETWVSSDLKIAVMRTDSDPRFGTTTMELSNVSRAEPAASLFQAPAGYAVQEHTPGQRGPVAEPLP